MTADGVRVSGGAAPEELAAVLAVLSARRSLPAPIDGYERWRATRLEALRHKGSRLADEV